MRPPFVRSAGVLLAASLAKAAAAHEPDPSKYSYWKDVYPILRARCADCHASGGVGPMNLLRYEEAFPWAASIKREVLEGRMPPWLPEEGWGEHLGARTLTAEEIDILVDWASGGAPEGARAGAAEPEMARDPSWALGEPDLVLEAPVESRIPAEQVEETTCWVGSIGNGEMRWLSAIDFRPGNAAIVRSARVDRVGACPIDSGTRPLLAWVPGQKPFRLPRRAGEPIPARSRVAVTIHYRKSWRDDGKELRDRSRVGLYFGAPGPPLGSSKLDEPIWRSDRDLELLSLWPAPAGGEPIQVEVRLPDGRELRLLQVRSIRPEWLTKFFFRQPVILPAGSELRVSPPGFWIEHLEPER